MIKRLAIFIMFLFSTSGITYGAVVGLPQTGQTTCYAEDGAIIDCAGTGQDGDTLTGVAWPVPRFTDNGDQTITDTLTGLMWLKDGRCLNYTNKLFPKWQPALELVAGLNDGTQYCNYQTELPGPSGAPYADWRVPNIIELNSLVNAAEPYSLSWLGTQGFTNVFSYFWSSTTSPLVGFTAQARGIGWSNFTAGSSQLYFFYKTGVSASEWPVWAVRTAFPANTVWRTGQTECYSDQLDSNQPIVIDCTDTGQDGELLAGVALPDPRFTDNGDGTVTDELTGLIWLQDANCFVERTWTQALSDANSLASGSCGLSDGSNAGDWRLPNRLEAISLLDYSSFPTLSAGHPFTNVKVDWWSLDYWSSTTDALTAGRAWSISLYGYVKTYPKTDAYYVWPVRTGAVTTSAPKIDVSPLIFNFNDVVVGDSSIPLQVTISNTGTDDLDVSDIALSGTTFNLNVNGGSAPCGMTPLTLEADVSCTVEVTFMPGEPGMFDNTLMISSNDSVELTVSVSLSGNGVAVPAPEISVSLLTYTFSDVVVGGSSSPLGVTINNTGTDVLNVEGIALASGTDYGLDVNGGSDPCGMTPLTVEADVSCTVEVTFIPSVAGSNISDTLIISSNDSDESTVEIVLTGNGTSAPAPNISVSPLTLDSGEVVIYDSSSPSEVTISNIGTDVLNVTDIALSDSTNFSLNINGGSEPCGMTTPTVAFDESCTVTVTFTPDAVGVLNAVLTITSDDAEEPDVDVLLTGVGLDHTITPVTGAAGTGTITIDTSDNAGTYLSEVRTYLDTDPSLNQTGKPADVEFPDGLVAFKVNNVAPGGTVDVTITFPTAFPEGATYYKVDADGFYEFQGAVINGSTVILTLTDGGLGDNDGIANGVIDDPGGVAIAVADIKTETSTDAVPRSKDHSNFFGCSIKANNAGQGFDPLLPMSVLMSVVYLFNRRRRTRN